MKKPTATITSGDMPVVFSDGTAIYNTLAETYKLHKKGFFILAPSGTGKTYYINHQDQKDWIDGDILWSVTGADFNDETWGDTFEDVLEINARSDVITHQAKKQGFWVLGSSNMFLQPDAIVLPTWETHLAYIKTREQNNYDGGATSSDVTGVQNHRRWIEKTWSDKVPIFKSIEAATDHIMGIYNSPENTDS
jgi:hypothetical protein